MAPRTMTTRRSSRNLLQAEQQENGQNLNETSDAEGTNHRDYDLNYERAMKKKARACQAGYLVSSEVKGDN